MTDKKPEPVDMGRHQGGGVMVTNLVCDTCGMDAQLFIDWQPTARSEGWLPPEEVAELRKDAERLDYIEKEWFSKCSENTIYFNFSEVWDAGAHENLRAAIDAAREKP